MISIPRAPRGSEKEGEDEGKILLVWHGQGHRSICGYLLVLQPEQKGKRLVPMQEYQAGAPMEEVHHIFWAITQNTKGQRICPYDG